MDLEFREQRRGLTEFLIRFQKNSALENKYVEGLRRSASMLSFSEKLQIAADMNHMHLNRLFLKDQRRLERKSYWFLGKVVRGFPANWPGRQLSLESEREDVIR